MAVAVNIYIKDSAVIPQAIASVVVNVYDPSTMSLIASASSDVNGRAAFLLDGTPDPGTTYEVRFFKMGVLFPNPRLIAVKNPLPPLETNNFDVTGTLQTIPVATDPRLCRCTGQFVNYKNQPVADILIRVAALAESGFQTPKVVDGNMVSPSAMEFRTDSNGRVSFDLLRTGEYYVMFAGEDDTVWNICVPDRSSANLIELIHPQPVLLEWNQTDAPGNAISVHIEETKNVRFSITFSDYVTRTDGLDKWVELTNSDGAVMELDFYTTEATAIVKGLSVGTAQVTVSVKPELLPPRLPDYSITAPALNVTVIA